MFSILLQFTYLHTMLLEHILLRFGRISQCFTHQLLTKKTLANAFPTTSHLNNDSLTLTHREDGIQFITLNNVKKRNVLSMAMMDSVISDLR